MAAKKTASTTKDKLIEQILAYCGNPANPFPNRKQLALDVCEYKSESGLYRHFTPDELSDLDRQALDMRRKKYAPHISEIDMALIKQAKTGDHKAAELAYKRFEGWTPTERRITENKLLIMD